MEDSRKRQKHLMLLIFIAFIAALIWEILSGGTGAVSFHTEDEYMTLAGPEGTSIQINYSDITDISGTTDFEPGSAVDGGTKGKVNYGTWENDTLGTYESFVDTRIDTVIVIRTDDVTVAFNYEDENATGELLQALPDFAGLSSTEGSTSEE